MYQQFFTLSIIKWLTYLGLLVSLLLAFNFANASTSASASSSSSSSPSPSPSSSEASPLAQNPVVEKRLIAISAELRCLVCQNESLAGSQAELAIDLRNQVRDLIIDNKTDQEILDYLTTRYGDFVLYRPPFKPLTWVLWTAPAILAAVGAFILFRRIRKKPTTTSKQLNADEIAKAQSLLNDR